VGKAERQLFDLTLDAFREHKRLKARGNLRRSQR
jgi:hypothetical protein